MKLLEQFETMQYWPIIEINLKDYNLSEDDEYEAYYLYADAIGLHTGSITVEWDEDKSLDSHLKLLMEKIDENLRF